MDGPPDLSGFTPDQADEALAIHWRAAALHHLTYMHLEPRGRATAWAAARTFADHLLPNAGAGSAFPATYRSVVVEYVERRRRGKSVDHLIRKLNRLCALEGVRQGRIGRKRLRESQEGAGLLTEGME